MKIAFIIPHYYPAVSFGGPPVVVHDLAKALVSEGSEVSIFCGDALDSNHRILKRNIFIDGVTIHYFKELSTHLAYRNNLYLTPGFFSIMIQHIRHFDLIHIHELYTVQNLFAGFLASKLKKPFIISPHGSLTESSMRGKTIVKKLSYFINRSVYRKAAKFVALTEKEKKECLRWGIPDEKINIIPNGINSPQIASYKEKIDFRKKWKISDNAQIILYMGRLHPIKRLDLLIASFAEARKKDSALFLIIAGPDAGVKKDLKNLALNLLPPNSYVFTGVVRDSDKNVLLSQAKISMLTSYSEGLSQFALESASWGIPLIATHSCGQDFITKYCCGEEVSENSIDVAAGMIKLLHNRGCYRQYSKNGKIMTVEKYSWRSIAKKYKELYDSINKRSIL